MSAMTGARYVVETAAEQLAREQRREWERFVQVRGELEALRAEAEAYRSVYGNRIAKVPAGRRVRPNQSPRRIADATTEIADLVRREREALRSAVLDASQADVSGLLTAPAEQEASARRQRAWEGSVIVSPAETAPRDAAAEQRAEQARERAAARRRAAGTRAAELVARLPASTPEEIRAPCAAAAAEIAGGASDGRVRLLLNDLEKRVRAQQRAEERVERTRRELLAVVAPLESVSGEAADRLRSRIERLIAQRAAAVPDGLRLEADAVVAQADSARRRRAVANALRVGLVDLGYDIGEGFETSLAGTGVAFAAMNDDGGYGVKVMLDRDDAIVRTQVVRAGSTRAGRDEDVAAEQKFCNDYEVLTRRMRKQGVPISDVARQEPGRLPMQAVADEVIPARAHRAGQRAREREA